MCGIVAIITPDRELPYAVLASMRDRMLHRGPDAGGEWVDRYEEGAAGLGHRRLSIIDLSSGGAQPMFSEDERYVLIFNGEIYNYIELRDELKSIGCRFRSESDSEVLLQSYIIWGKECLPKLNGMFSFCIWDRKKRTLFCARDRFGEKPLYYAGIPGGGIILASEIKAIFAHPALQPQKNETAISEFLMGGASYASKETFFTNVKRFPAAHCASFDRTGKEIERYRYWKPEYRVDNPDLSPEEGIEKFSDLLSNALKMRLRSNVKVGACLSGGLDSSTIVGMLSDLHKKGETELRHTYSARFDNDPEISEGHYIDLVQKHCGFDPISVTPDGSQISAESERLHWHQEQPFLSASMYLEWCVVRAARQTGTTVLLDGQGADEVLGGYLYHFEDMQEELLSKGDISSFYSNTKQFYDRIETQRKYSSDYSRRTGFNSFNRYRAIPRMIKKRLMPYKEQNHLGSFRSNLERGLLYDTLPNNLHSADANGMAHSIETRFPYLDYDLVDWCTRMPDHLYIHNGWMKYVLRMAAKNYIPDKVKWRVDKVGFAAPQDKWLRESLNSWAKEKLFYGPVTELEFFNKKVVEDLWDEHSNGSSDKSWDLWRLISLNEWLTLFDNGTWKNGIDPKITTLGSAA